MDHKACESLEGTWDTNSGRDFDQNTFGGMDVDLQLAGFVNWRVEKGQEALYQVSIVSFLELAIVLGG